MIQLAELELRLRPESEALILALTIFAMETITSLIIA